MAITNLEILKDGELADVAPLNDNFETIRVAINDNSSLVGNLATRINNLVNNINDILTKISIALLPVGTKIETFEKLSNPSEYRLFLCDWSAVSRTAYSELFKVIGIKHGSGDGSTTFNLPNCMNGEVARSYKKGVTAETGKIQKGGIPNIIGAIYHKGTNGHNVQAHSWSGALINAGVTSGMMRSEGGGSYSTGTAINASKSSSLYGASPNEVRMNNYAVYVYIRY